MAHKMQVKFRSHFSGKRVRLMGREIRYFANTTMFVYFSLIIFVFNNLDNFKTNLLLHDFNTWSKNQLPFLSVKLTFVKMGVIFSATKIFNQLLSNIMELQENKMLFKSALRKYLLTHVF